MNDINRPKNKMQLSWLLLPLGLVLAACQPSIPPAPRNLVVICIDTVRFDSFFHPGIVDQLSPWIDRAQVYENAQAPGPWTIPSVVSLFTGQYPIEHGAGRFKNEVANLNTDLPSPLHADALTMAEILDNHYFRTGAFVSHPFFQADLGLKQGFQQVHNRRGWWRDVERFWKWADRIEAPHRFFGYLHFMEAHHRHTRSPEEMSRMLEDYDADTQQALRERARPDLCKNSDNLRCLQNMIYEASMLELRKAIATVLNDLEERHLIDETLVVLYSDHGEEFWEHEAQQTLLDEDPRGKFGFGHGQNLYQELLHVPLMIWHPEIEGKRHPQRVSLVDVLPSLIAWLALENVDIEVSGKWLKPLRKSYFSFSGDRQVWSSGIAYGPEKISSLRGNMKSIFSLRDDRFEFYDLADDPRETAPIDDNKLIMEFDTLTGDYLEMEGRYAYSRGWLDSSQIKPGQLDDLKAIGYLQGVESESQTDEESAPENDEAQLDKTHNSNDHDKRK
jgi:arylsulfatase A-like enzyme